MSDDGAGLSISIEHTMVDHHGALHLALQIERVAIGNDTALQVVQPGKSQGFSCKRKSTSATSQVAECGVLASDQFISPRTDWTALGDGAWGFQC